ncbi:MAG: FlgD immunoglobulin-like domain containing protein [candidate division WOR-3 bacterium]
MTALLIAVLLSQPAPNPPRTSDAADTTQRSDAHTLGEELVTGEAEVKVEDQKPYLPPQIDPFSPVNDLLLPGSYVFDEALARSVDSLTIPSHFLRSSTLRVPVERDFIYGDIVVFLPAFEKRVATWELIISNSLGETVRRVNRRGQPPAVITWDGRTENGELVPVGDVYTFTFNAYDAQGNQTRIPGDPQRIGAVVTQQGDAWVVAIAADLIFNEGTALFSEQAPARIDEAANIVRERYRREVVVYIYSEQERLSADRCRAIQTELSRRLTMPQEALKVAPRFIHGLSPKHSRIEIHIL